MKPSCFETSEYPFIFILLEKEIEIFIILLYLNKCKYIILNWKD